MNPKKAKVPAVTPEEDYGDRWMRLIWNNDLLTKIFILLPAKSIIRCKLVCKHWLSLMGLLYVYNPTTKLSRKISVTDSYRDNIVALALIFDPSMSLHYKDVCIKSTSEDRIIVLRLKLCGGYGGVYCNGWIYWEMLDAVVYYDIAKNEFESILKPSYSSYQYQLRMVHWDTTYCLHEANGRLYISRCLTKANDCLSVELFELEMGEGRSLSWFLRYYETIPQHEPTSPLNGYIDQLRVIKGPYGTETFSVVYHMGGKISVYSFLDKSHNVLVDLTGQPFVWGPELKMYEFIACLAVV
ncbi:F-box protein At5g07610-like [Salvia splendens]|uniref:F-box protein At5g07610-like n=1 Tax=Salvia splendens TaxID=180675 RepID=UPI001C278400|nr:F-box protein At5g07610-like [Salvia splendens]